MLDHMYQTGSIQCLACKQLTKKKQWFLYCSLAWEHLPEQPRRGCINKLGLFRWRSNLAWMKLEISKWTIPIVPTETWGSGWGGGCCTVQLGEGVGDAVSPATSSTGAEAAAQPLGPATACWSCWAALASGMTSDAALPVSNITGEGCSCGLGCGDGSGRCATSESNICCRLVGQVKNMT